MDIGNLSSSSDNTGTLLLLCLSKVRAERAANAHHLAAARSRNFDVWWTYGNAALAIFVACAGFWNVFQANSDTVAVLGVLSIASAISGVLQYISDHRTRAMLYEDAANQYSNLIKRIECRLVGYERAPLPDEIALILEHLAQSSPVIPPKVWKTKDIKDAGVRLSELKNELDRYVRAAVQDQVGTHR